MPPRARPNKKERALAFVNFGNAYHAFYPSAIKNLSLFYFDKLLKKPNESVSVFEKSSQHNEVKPDEEHKKKAC